MKDIMKNAIVTGACSPIGSAIVAKLTSEGYSVTGWCRCKGFDLRNPNIDFGAIPELDAVIHVSEVGPLPLTKLWEATRNHLLDRKGVFVGLSSTYHLTHEGVYAESKREQEVLLRSMALWSSSVRVNCLRLGHIVGEKAWPKEMPERIAEIPLGRFGTPQDVAEAVSFIVRSGWMTGSAVTLDGGMSLKLMDNYGRPIRQYPKMGIKYILQYPRRFLRYSRFKIADALFGFLIK